MGFESAGSAAQVGLPDPSFGSARGGYDPSGWTSQLIDDNDPRVIAALEDYLAAAERGERPDRFAFLARHPEIAPRLADCLESLDRLTAAAPHFDPMTLDDTGPFPPAVM